MPLYSPRQRRNSNAKTLRGVRPNAGVAAKFNAQLQALIRQMHADTMKVIGPTYRQNPPEMAQDALSSAELSLAMKQLATKWLANFDMLAQRLAEYFAQSTADRSDSQLQRILRQGGMSVNFTLTPEMQDVLGSIVHENVSLIKSIPQQYLNQVEGSVMRSIQTGRDLATLSTEIQNHYGVTKRRAALIARDQNNKATSALTRVRQMNLGITEGIWKHSHAGKEPRPTHVAMDGERYPLAEGMYDSAVDKYVHPGELINCRCFWQPVVHGL